MAFLQNISIGVLINDFNSVYVKVIVAPGLATRGPPPAARPLRARAPRDRVGAAQRDPPALIVNKLMTQSWKY